MAVINSPTLGKHLADITDLDNGGDVEVTSEDITDSTATGRAVLTAADPGAARTAIGAGTSNVTVGTGATNAKAGNYQPTWEQVTNKPAVIAAGATQADARTAIGAGTSTVSLVATGGNNGSAATAARSDHTHAGLLSGSASSVADATDETDVVDQLNALLGVLRTRGVLSS